MNSKLDLFMPDLTSVMSLPFADDGIKAGFPSPAQDMTSGAIDLNKELIHHPATTFYARVVGDSMVDAGLEDGDLLVIDKSLSPVEGDKVVAFIDGEFTIKYIRKGEDCYWLVPANEEYEPIRVTEENDFLIWGVVTYSIKKQRGRK